MDQEQPGGTTGLAPGGGRLDADAGITALFDLSFKRFITLSVIKVLYILGMVLIALSWALITIGALTQGIGQGFLALVFGALFALVYLIFFRIWLEIIVVIFRIGENTSKIASRGGP